jgi:hypothetical protein
MDRVCQQALVQVLAPIFEPTFREASFGYRPGRSAHGAMRRIWRRLGQAEWIVDGDISDFLGRRGQGEPGLYPIRKSGRRQRLITPRPDTCEAVEQRPGRGGGGGGGKATSQREHGR